MAPVSHYQAFVEPAIRDAWIYLAGVSFWFFVQHFVGPILGSVFLGKKWRDLSKVDKLDWNVRVCSAINSLICARTAYYFFTYCETGKLGDDPYATIQPDSYHYNRVMIVAYFIWDVIVCHLYSWGAAYTVHGWLSLIGTYCVAYPFSDRYAPYYTGVFELSNIFIHTSAMLDLVKVLPTISKLLQYLFGLMFVVFRVIGGTYYCYRWMSDMYKLYLSGEAHSNIAVFCLVFILSCIMIMQYIWFTTIIKTVLGRGEGPPSPKKDKK